MFRRDDLKHIHQIGDREIKFAISDQSGAVHLTYDDRVIFISPAYVDECNEILHQITTIRTIETEGKIDRRYKEISLTTSGVVALYLALYKYILENKIDVQTTEDEDGASAD